MEINLQDLTPEQQEQLKKQIIAGEKEKERRYGKNGKSIKDWWKRQ